MENNDTNIETMNLSDQALGAIMMALQDSLMNQTDIVPTLKGMNFVSHPSDGLIVINPPVLRTNHPESGDVETSVQ